MFDQERYQYDQERYQLARARVQQLRLFYSGDGHEPTLLFKMTSTTAPMFSGNQLLEVLRNSLCEPRLICALFFRKVKYALSAVCLDAAERLRRVRSNQRVQQRQ